MTMASLKRLLFGAVCGTIAAVLGWILILLGESSVLQILSTLLFTLSAGISWRQYIKERQEEKDHD